MTNQNGQRPVLVVGIGNRFRSDDAAGLVVADEIAKRKLVGVETFISSGEILSLIERWKSREHVYIFDAMKSDRKPGAIFRCRADDGELPHELTHFSSHSFGVNELIALAVTLKQMPGNLTIIGIAGQCYHHGTTLSEPVAQALHKLVDEVVSELRGL